jgi:Spy/CpxP family protein refolding chaperone
MGLLPGLDRVNLTDTQREQIRGILEEERQSGDDPAGKMREAEHALVSGVLAGDAGGIEAGKAAVNAAQTAGLERRIELMQKVAQVLTAEQRQQLAELPPPPGPRGRGRGDR